MAFMLGSLGFAGRLLWYGACLSSDRLGGSLYSQVLPWYGACLSSDRLGGSLYLQAFHGYQQQASDRLGGSLSCCFHFDLASDRLGGSLPCHFTLVFLTSSFYYTFMFVPPHLQPYKAL